MNGNKLTISYQHFNPPPTIEMVRKSQYHQEGERCGILVRKGLTLRFLISTLGSENEGTNCTYMEESQRDTGRRLFGTTKICIPWCFSHFFKMIIRGAVLFWMTVYPWLMKPKRKIQTLCYQLAIESQYSSDKSITWNPWRAQMRATKSCTCNGEP